LNRVDRRLPDAGVGDILLVVAHRAHPVGARPESARADSGRATADPFMGSPESGRFGV